MTTQYRYFDPKNGIKDLYQLCGIYFLIHGDEIDYIGRSVNIGNRLCGHHVFDRKYHTLIAVYEVPFKDARNLKNIERKFIKEFHPKRNINATEKQSQMQTGRKRAK